MDHLDFVIGEFQDMKMPPPGKALLQPILQAIHVYLKGRLEVEFRGLPCSSTGYSSKLSHIRRVAEEDGAP